MHARTVVTHDGLGHEGGGLAVTGSHVLNAVLEHQHFVSLTHQRAGADADLALAAGGDFVVVHFDDHAHLFQGIAHLGTDIVQRVDRGHGEVAALYAWTMTQVGLLAIAAVAVPSAGIAVDLVEAAVHLGLPLHIVEHEEFVFRSEQRVVSDAGGLQVGLGATRQRTRIALVTLHGGRLDDVAAQVQRGLVEERIEHGAAGVGQQNHVRLVDALPAGNRGAIEHLAFREQGLFHGVRGHRNVLFLAAGIAEAEVDPLDLFLCDDFQNICRCRHSSSNRKCFRLPLAPK